MIPIDKIIQEFHDRHAHCIASDAQYTDAEMVKILTRHIQKSDEEDAEWLRTVLEPLNDAAKKET